MAQITYYGKWQWPNNPSPSNLIIVRFDVNVVFLGNQDVGETRIMTFQIGAGSSEHTLYNNQGNGYDPSVTDKLLVKVVQGSATLASRERRHSDADGSGDGKRKIRRKGAGHTKKVKKTKPWLKPRK